ncbi:MAG TPA: hypothetical protein VK914_12030 [bacterium]|jgi:hypothetical protein|nr:hypothetical protein [bacterium]
MRTAFTRQFSSVALLAALLIAGWAPGLDASGPPLGPSATPTPIASFTRVPPTASPSATAKASFGPTRSASPTPSPSASATPTPALSPTATPVLPQAPDQVQGSFEVLTATGQAPQTAVKLQWYPSEPGDYLIDSYHVYRSTDGGQSFKLRPAVGAGSAESLDLDDRADVGLDYDYYVVAVDSRGLEGARSPLAAVDLRHLPADKLASPAPEGLSATSRMNDVKLVWKKASPWISPWSAYRVYRASSLAGLPQGFLCSLTGSALALLPVSQPLTSTSTSQPLSVTSRNWDVFANFSAPSATAWNAATATASTTVTAQAASATAQALTATAAAPVQTGDLFYFYDQPPVQKRDYYYAVTSLDQDGHESPMGVTVLARATGPLPPGQPLKLTSTSKTEQVILDWKPAKPGTADLSGYILTRRPTDSEHWHKVAMLDVSATTYSESLEGGSYIYRLSAYDAAGNTGAAAYVAAHPAEKILNNTLIITMPTAYANNPGRDTGFNLNVLFDFYVGSLFESYTSPLTNQSQASIFQELEIGTVSLDLKYAFLDDRGWTPGLAVGMYTSALIGFGGNSETVGISSSGGDTTTLGDVYAVVSKRPFAHSQAALHFGIMHGDLASDLTHSDIPTWAWPTIRHFLPSGAVPELLTSFVDPALGQAVGESPNMLFFGLNFPFTVPLGFTDWRTGLRLEALLPMAWEAAYPPSESPTNPSAVDTATENGNPASQLPYLVNVHVDNLPLFGFEFGFFEFSGGYEVIAFYHIPDLNWAW